MILALVEPRPAGRARLWTVAVLAAVLALGGLTWPAQASALDGVPQTYVGHVYGDTVTNPNADKPQSKLWYHAGSWWALMAEAGGTAVRIHELMPDHTWRNTGATVDGRRNSTGDALWSARNNRLYVASRTTGANLLVNAFTFDATHRSWATAAGFPVTLPTGGSESATIDQDSTGRLWVTYTRGSRLWVAHSEPNGTTWSAPFQPNVGDTLLSSDDISALITFGTSIGLLWSDQESGAVRFAVRDVSAPDSAPWQVEDALEGAGLADDHLNVKQLVGDSTGRIFAAVKTSADAVPGASPDDTLVGVLVRTPGAGGGPGTWELAPAGTLAQGWTRPIIMIDSESRELYFFATTGVGGSDIVYKKSPLDEVSFPAGPGQPFVDASLPVNNPSGAKDPVTSATGLVILADSKDAHTYVHAELGLGTDGGGPVDPAPTASTQPASGATGVPLGGNVTATFSEDVSGVSDSSFTVRPVGGTADVVATVTYDAAARVATLDPADSLAANTSYTATLSGVTDSAGQALSPNPTTWSFTTETAPVGPAPTVTARAPATGATNVGRTTNVTATFSEPVTGVDRTTFTLTDLATNAVVPAVVSRNGTTDQWILNPNSGLSPDTRYRATLSTGIRNAAGTTLAATETWDFLVGPAPRISARTPATGATGVSRTTDIAATFSEPVLDVTTTTFTVRQGTKAPVAAVVTRNGTTNQWVLNPGTTLAAKTRYTVTVTGGTGGTGGITDVAGNPLTTLTWNFTTGS
jgi:hypothetical protein